MSKFDFHPLRRTCVNHGCNNKQVYYRVSKKTGDPTFRKVCTNCHESAIGRSTYKTGVTPLRIGKCANTDGHLGWVCNFDPSIYPEGIHPPTQIDHIDGDHQNNAPDNLEELCACCHQAKTFMNGDNKKGRTARKKIMKESAEKFGQLFD